MSVEHVDVLIVGGGLSGICAAVNLQQKCPRKSYAILESRSRLGGTWDLFRYPGVRSDSDMFTLGYSFKPWTGAQAIAAGGSILEYLEDTARQFGVGRKIRFDHCVKRAAWSSAQALWTIEAERGPERTPLTLTCNFLFACSGYYQYTAGYTPTFTGSTDFKGRIVHPQQWPAELDYTDKRVVVIGSGATAVTLVPELAKAAASVTMLQRSPTYVIAAPYQDRIAKFLRRRLSPRLSHPLIRWRNILLGIYFYSLCKRKPERAKQMILKGVRSALGDDYDVAKHFTPRYNPWDQRMCLVPDGDLFAAIRSGCASVVTDEIERFTADGIRLRSGAELPADLVITATGLNLVMLGGVQVSIDGRPADLSKTMNYKGSMFGGVPNLASVFGYTNASWTLKAELICDFICRLLNFMEQRGFQVCTPQNEDATITEERWLDLSSGYIQRVADQLPKQGSKAPWKLRDNYWLDRRTLKKSVIDDGVMKFGHARSAAA